MKKTKFRKIDILLTSNHIKILRFLLDEFNKSNDIKKFKANQIACQIKKQQTKTKEWLFHLRNCELIKIEEKIINGKTKRYDVYITKDEILFIEMILNIFEKFC